MTYTQRVAPRATTYSGYRNQEGPTGVYTIIPNRTETIRENPVTEYTKSATLVQGDRKGNYPYEAAGFELVTDNPRVTRSYSYQDLHGLNGEYLGRTVYAMSESSYYLSVRNSFQSFNPEYPDSYQENARKQSVTKALNDLAVNSTQLGASLGEGRQVVDMFADLTSQLARAIIQMRQGNFAAVAAILGFSPRDVLTGKSLANFWLQYQYGWKPLFGQIFEAQEKVHEVITKDSYLSGKAKSETVTNSRTWVEGTSLHKKESTLSTKTMISAKVNTPSIHSLSSWGLLNPASVAWELVPFSFVIDWFMPVGNTLNACTAGLGLTFMGGATTYKKVSTYEVTGDTSEGNNTVLSTGSWVGKKWSFWRNPLIGMPIGEFYADLTPFSTPRVANAAALLRQIR